MDETEEAFVCRLLGERCVFSSEEATRYRAHLAAGLTRRVGILIRMKADSQRDVDRAYYLRV